MTEFFLVFPLVRKGLSHPWRGLSERTVKILMPADLYTLGSLVLDDEHLMRHMAGDRLSTMIGMWMIKREPFCRWAVEAPVVYSGG